MTECWCPSCVSIRLGVCELCWENPCDFVDEDGQRWNICWGCAFREQPTRFAFPC